MWVAFLNFESRRRVPHLIFEEEDGGRGGPWISHLKLRGIPGPTLKL